MSTYDLKELRKAMKEVLKKDRYEHSSGVAYTSASLAMRYDPSLVESAMVAGLLHDCAKCYDKEKLLDYCKKNGLLFSRSELCTPALLHSKAGALLAKTQYQIDDKDILSAIYWHTTGRPAMTLLEKIVYYISLDTITYLESTNAPIDDEAYPVYEYYRNYVSMHCPQFLREK